jgi:hypothetical protein
MNLELLSMSSPKLQNSVKKYFSMIFDSLTQTQSNNKCIDKLLFKQFIDKPCFISERVFNELMRASKAKIMTKEHFTSCFFELYTYNLEEKARFIFNLLDIDDDGRVMEVDLRTFLFYCKIADFKEYEYLFQEQGFLSFVQFYDYCGNLANKLYSYIIGQTFALLFFLYKELGKNEVRKLFQNEEEIQSDDENRLIEAVNEDMDLPDLHLDSIVFNNKFYKTNNVATNNARHSCPTPITSIIPSLECEIEDKINHYLSSYVKKGGYMCMQRDGCMKKYWVVLVDNKLLFSKSINSRIKYIINLKSCFVTKHKEFKSNRGNDYFKLTLTFSNKLELFIKDKIEADKWIEAINQAIGFRDIRQDYIFEEMLGKGAVGKVVLAKNKQSNEKYAIKIITKTQDKCLFTNYEGIYREIEILKCCNHKNIVQYIDSYEDSEKIYIVMEYLEHNLLTYVQKYKYLNENRARNITKQIAEGVKYLQSYNIIHMDLKHLNIMLSHKDNKMIVKLIDFGLSKTLHRRSEKLDYLCGTLDFLSPEVILYKKIYHNTDIWSLGLITYYLLYGHVPFSSGNDMETLYCIVKEKLTLLGNSNVSNCAVDLITKCLCKDPNERIKVDELFNHPWFN